MKHHLASSISCGSLDLKGFRRIIRAKDVRTFLLASLIVLNGAELESSAGNGSPVPPSVILISIDTLRADHLSAYGYSIVRTPHIDSFAEGGTLFTRAEAQVPLTLPSHTSLFTSTYSFENLVEENGERVPAGTVTLASVLRSHGYKTAAFIGSDFLDRRYGLDQGFDDYDSPFGERNSNPMAASLRRDGALVVRAARQWLDAHRGQPVFVFVHLFDLHVPYTLPPEVAQKQGISRYDAQLVYVDQLLGRFQQELKQQGWWDNSLLVVFGDHGEGLGDHRETDHGYYIYESTLHVPLIMHWASAQIFPLKADANGLITLGDRRFDPVAREPLGLIDVAPTILDYLRMPVPASFQGTSQLGRIGNAESAGPPHAVYSESVYAHDAFGWAPLRAIRLGKYKYIQSPKAELYDLDFDPGERLNLLPKNFAMAAELQNDLAAILDRYKPARRPAPSALSPETLAELESLGYLAAAPRRDTALKSSSAPLPDPKDRFAEFELYQNAYLDFTEGRAPAAVPKLQSILKSDPQNTLARFHLGQCYLQLKNPQGALNEWTTLLNLAPDYAPAAEALGDYWLQRGDYEKARRRFQQVLALTPESFTGHFQLAVADQHLGLLAEASRQMEMACKIAPHDKSCAGALKPLSPN